MASQSNQKNTSFVKRHAGKLVLGAAIAGGYYAYTNYSHFFSVDYWLPDEFRRLKTVLEEQALNPDHERAPTRRDAGQVKDHTAIRSVATPAGGYKNASATEQNDRLHEMLAKVIALAASKLSTNLDSDKLRLGLRSCGEDSSAKLDLWDRLRQNSWKKCIVAVYTLSHSILLLSIKLAIAVRYIRAQKLFDSTPVATVTLASHHSASVLLGDESALQLALARYLDAVDFLIGEGFDALTLAVHECVERFTKISLAEPVDKSVLTSVFFETRRLIENKQCVSQKATSIETSNSDAAPSPNLSIMQTNYHIDFLLPPLNNDGVTNGHHANQNETVLFNELHRETVEVLRSMECNMVLACLLETAFKSVADELADFISATSSNKLPISPTEVKTNASIPHAKLLPALEKIASRILSPPAAENSLSTTLLNLSYLSLFEQRVQAGQVVAVSGAFRDVIVTTKNNL